MVRNTIVNSKQFNVV